MEAKYIDLPVLKDNDFHYFSLLEGVINSVDELSTMEVRNNITNYSFRITLSSSIYAQPLIRELNSLHNLMGIRVEFSKSIKSSFTLSFKINLAGK